VFVGTARDPKTQVLCNDHNRHSIGYGGKAQRGQDYLLTYLLTQEVRGSVDEERLNKGVWND